MKNIIKSLLLIFVFVFSLSLFSQEPLINNLSVSEINDQIIRLDNQINERKTEKLTTQFSEEDLEKHGLLNDQIKELEKTKEHLIEAKDKLDKDEQDAKAQYFGTPLYDAEDFWKLLVKGLFNLLVVFIIVRYIYYPITKNKDYLFTYFLISLTVFLLCFLLDNVKLQLGFALGLFAIFGIIRYRTDPIPIKEMTYLFLVIGISVVNALANKKISYSELLFANLILVFITYGLEKLWLLRHESRRNITYEKIELIVPDRRDELLLDLKKRTGLDIIRIEIRRIDFLRDVANIRIFYYEEDSK